MDNIREKLVELLKKDPCPSTYLCDGNCKYADLERCFEERFADHLIRHGVTVQEWIPVTDRLPTKEDAKIMGGYLLAIQNGKKPNVWKWTEVAKYPECFTYWYSLPTPPKGE